VLYRLLKPFARIAIRIFCRHISLNRPELLQADGPLLLAANHPNSFLDGIILTILFDRPVYSLARGDAFAHPRLKRLLKGLHLLPVYRTSEGAENLQHNYTTFAACEEVFRKRGIVLIFSEGACVNEWHLRPLRKGTARLALGAWQEGIPLTVIPVAFNYSPFRNFGKNVFIEFGRALEAAAITSEPTEGRQLLAFNEQLRAQLEELVYEIDPSDKNALREKLYVPVPTWKKIALAPLATFGFLAHAPLYFPLKALAEKKFNNDHFDSILVAFLFAAYPFYLLLLYGIACMFLPATTSLLVFLLLPVCAWATVQLKNQLSV
jgi:1-acyl-sn-glycerol-3-phosphate acyltransferase